MDGLERWVDVQNLEPQIEELPGLWLLRKGRVSSVAGVKAWDTPSDMDSLLSVGTQTWC